MEISAKRHFFTRDRDFYARFFRLLLFISLQNIITTSVSLADNIMLGRFSENALAGVAQVNQIQFLLQMIVNGAAEGMLVLNAQYWGRRDVDAIKKVIAIALRVCVTAGIIMMLATLIFPRQLMLMLIKDEAVIEEGMKYMQVMSFSYIIFCVSNVLISALRGIENVKLGTAISLCTLVVNVSLNYLLIFDHVGLPQIAGTYGAAIATLAARVAELGIVVWYVLKKENVLKFRLRDALHFDSTLTGDFFRAALPVMATGAFWGLAMMVQAAILGHLGVTATASSSVANSVFQIISVLCYAAASAGGILIGKAVGRDDTDLVKSYSRTLQIIFLVIGVLTGLALYLVRDPILDIYSTLTPETREMSRKFMAVLAVTVVGTSYQCPVLSGIVRAGGSPKVQMYNDIIFMWGFVLPLSLLGAFVWNLDPVVVFIFLKCDQILKCGTAVVVCNRYRWIKRLAR